MSMLAERKQKQKWTLNPRGKYWSDDSNKFGQRMLEKMGWSSGKGLGAKEDGITEHIKQSYKNDSKGIGYEDKEDQWTKHEVDFTSLLQNLSNSDSIEIKKPEISLEKKSQSSRVRVHYHKFTRGKDLSRYSEKDLANVFGRKTLERKENIDTPIEESNSDSCTTSKGFGVVTVNSGSMTDYFKTKIKNILTKPTDEINSDDERPGFGFSTINTLDSNTDVKDVTFKSKFKSMFIKSTEDTSFEADRPAFGISQEIKETGNKENEDKKKKNKTKVVINECFDNPGFRDFPDVEGETVADDISQKKKRKKKRKELLAFENSALNVDFQNEGSESTPAVKKSKKRKLETIVEESFVENRETNDKIEDNYIPAKKKSKKDKKKKKNNENITTNEEDCQKDEYKNQKTGIDNRGCTEVDNFNEDNETLQKMSEFKLKKKKKRTNEIGICNIACSELNTIPEENIAYDESSDMKSSTKKKKIHHTEVGIYNVACTEDNKNETAEDTREVKSSAKKKKKSSCETGIINEACTELSSNDNSITTITEEITTPKESKKTKKKKSKDNGMDNLACTATSVQQNIDEAISSMSNAIDDYQLELENEINEKKAEKQTQNQFFVANSKRFNYNKKSVKNEIKGKLRYEFEGSNLPQIPGYGVDR